MAPGMAMDTRESAESICKSETSVTRHAVQARARSKPPARGIEPRPLTQSPGLAGRAQSEEQGFRSGAVGNRGVCPTAVAGVS